MYRHVCARARRGEYYLYISDFSAELTFDCPRSICIFAGDVTPVDIMCHLPAVCEEKGIPYAYTPSRADLGAAMGVKRGTVALLVRQNEEYKDLYDEVKEELSALNVPV